MVEPLHLRNGPMALDVMPGTGACWQALRYSPMGRPTVDILRRIPDMGGDPFSSGGFALVPWSNRLFDGHLITVDQTLVLPANREGIPHPVHGLGWQSHWQIAYVGAAAAMVICEHVASNSWPFDYQCTQAFRLIGQCVRVDLAMINTSCHSMPVGAGFHPWLVADKCDTVCFNAATVWQQNTSGWPVRECNLTGTNSFDFRIPRALGNVLLNHCYGGWQGGATLERRAHGICVRLKASSQLAHLVVYRTREDPWICIEPVTHATGAWSLPALHSAAQGVKWLEPGARLSVWMEIHVEDGILAGPD